MKKLGFFMVFALCWGITLSILAVDVDEDNKYIIIETNGYKVCWNKAARMGYMQAFVGGSDESILGEASRVFYHASKYGDVWMDWQECTNWEILEEAPGKTVIQYESRDGGTKEYTVVASYYDSVPYIKHEVTVTNTGNEVVMSFENGCEPMLEVNTDIEGMESFNEPFLHAVYWTESGYFGGIYGPDANEVLVRPWKERDPGRTQLKHDALGKQIKKGESGTITYYVAFSKGGRDEATDLANDVQKEPAVVRTVLYEDKLATTWGQVRARYQFAR